MSKKIIFSAIAFLISVCVFTSCSKDGGEPKPEERPSEGTTTTGAWAKVEMGDGEYEISRYDDGGAGAKAEHYKNGKLAYYYINAAVDENGNCVRQDYYSPDGRLLCSFENGAFLDADGEPLSEEKAEKILEN